jgi:uncharacterized protein
VVTVEVAGETLALLPKRAVYWARERMLLIADVHLGKTATFRAYGVPLSDSSMAADLQRLSHVITTTGAEKLVILGDLLHAAKGRDAQTLAAFTTWRHQHASLAIDLVRGNHDRAAGDPPPEWNIDTMNSPTPQPPFVFAHEPFTPVEGYALTGHLHPAAQLVGKGRQTLKLPCFWFGARCAVLPAFGSFTGLAVIQPSVGDKVYVIAESIIDTTA